MVSSVGDQDRQVVRDLVSGERRTDQVKALYTLAGEADYHDREAIPMLIEILEGNPYFRGRSFIKPALSALARIDPTDERIVEALVSIEFPPWSSVEIVGYATINLIGPRDPRLVEKCVNYVRLYPSLFESRSGFHIHTGPIQAIGYVERFFRQLGPEHRDAAPLFLPLLREFPEESGAVSVAGKALSLIEASDLLTEEDVTTLLSHLRSNNDGAVDLLSQSHRFAGTILSVAREMLEQRNQPQKMTHAATGLRIIESLGSFAPAEVTPTLEGILRSLDPLADRYYLRYCEALIKTDPTSSFAIQSLKTYLETTKGKREFSHGRPTVHSLLARYGHEVDKNITALAKLFEESISQPQESAQIARLILQHPDAEGELRRTAIEHIIQLQLEADPHGSAAVISAPGLRQLLPTEREWEPKIRECVSRVWRHESSRRTSAPGYPLNSGIPSSHHLITLASALAALPHHSPKSEALLQQIQEGPDYLLNRIVSRSFAQDAER
ncbi:MAG: hypothetical protein SynsKO_09030 [Synoicihabitans sp.]